MEISRGRSEMQDKQSPERWQFRVDYVIFDKIELNHGNQVILFGSIWLVYSVSIFWIKLILTV